MADLAQPPATVRPDLSSFNNAPQLTRIAGEELFAGAACYLHSDNKLYLSNGTNADAEARFAGFALELYKLGEHATVGSAGMILCGYFSTAKTIGAKLYIGATNGVLADATTTGGTYVVAEVIGDAKGLGKDIRAIPVAA